MSDDRRKLPISKEESDAVQNAMRKFEELKRTGGVPGAEAESAPLGYFTWEMVDALRRAADGYKSGDFNGFNDWNDRQAALLTQAADLMAALLPPRELG